MNQISAKYSVDSMISLNNTVNLIQNYSPKYHKDFRLELGKVSTKVVGVGGSIFH